MVPEEGCYAEGLRMKSDIVVGFIAGTEQGPREQCGATVGAPPCCSLTREREDGSAGLCVWHTGLGV